MLKYFTKLISAVILVSFFGNSIGFAGNMTVVYIGAKNCPNCRKYEANDEQNFVKALKSKKASYKTVMVESFADISQEADYPKELKFIPKEGQLSRGTPHFVLLDGKNIILSVKGYDYANHEIMQTLN
jgi:hypothetical protein